MGIIGKCVGGSESKLTGTGPSDGWMEKWQETVSPILNDKYGSFIVWEI